MATREPTDKLQVFPESSPEILPETRESQRIWDGSGPIRNPQPDPQGAPESGERPANWPGGVEVSFADLVRRELARATRKFPRPQNSLHEAYAVLLEEVDELWDAIKGAGLDDPHHLLIECVQVGAMAERMARDCGLMAALEMPAGNGTHPSANLLGALGADHA